MELANHFVTLPLELQESIFKLLNFDSKFALSSVLPRFKKNITCFTIDVERCIVKMYGFSSMVYMSRGMRKQIGQLASCPFVSTLYFNFNDLVMYEDLKLIMISIATVAPQIENIEARICKKFGEKWSEVSMNLTAKLISMYCECTKNWNTIKGPFTANLMGYTKLSPTCTFYAAIDGNKLDYFLNLFKGNESRISDLKIVNVSNQNSFFEALTLMSSLENVEVHIRDSCEKLLSVIFTKPTIRCLTIIDLKDTQQIHNNHLVPSSTLREFVYYHHYKFICRIKGSQMIANYFKNNV